jgi:terminase large subunit-like protein
VTRKTSSPACSPRWATQRTPERPTLGDAAAAVAVELGTPLMPWQRQVLDVALELDPKTRRLVYREVILTVPRQSGKTTLLLVLILVRALSEPRQNIRYTAQTGSDARKKWMDDWLPILKPSRFSKLFHPRLTNGHEALVFHNGSFQSLIATTRKAGHAATIDLGILDEAFAHPDARLEQALKPAMITRPQPQLWIVSTAGTREDSPYLWGKVEAGRQLAEAGVNESVAYFEWSAPDDADPADRDTWRACMPALGRTATEDAIASDFASMPSLSEFRRAYLNQWVTALSDPVIPLDTWNALIDTRSEAEDPVCFAFDVSPDRSHAAIAAAGRRKDDHVHIEVIDHRGGTGWLAERLAELVQKHNPSGVYCDPTSPAASLLPELAHLRVDVTTLSGQEQAQACGLIFDAATQGTLRHLGSPELAQALDGAARKPHGDAWKWSRRSSNVDICPLVAVTLALWGLESQPKGGVGVWDLNEIVERLRREEGL